MEPLKNLYNKDFFNEFYSELSLITTIDKDVFFKKIFSKDWDQLELKERMYHISNVLEAYLNSDFSIAATEIEKLVSHLLDKQISKALEYMFLPHYIEKNGLDFPEISLRVFENITEFTSCEFAIRPFIITHESYVVPKLKTWSFHQNHHVRRLASEGCRPRLPWAMALPKYKKDPTTILSILNNLLNDPSEYVRKSVANNLNDISKDHPETLINFTKKHIGETEKSDWILKHACRTLLKQGNQTLMPLFGYGDVKHIDIQNFCINTPNIQIGDYLNFTVDVINNSNKSSKIRLEYAIHYLKKNNSLSKKVFKISEKEYAPHSRTTVDRKQHFKKISTRVYYSGTHKISIIANGKEFDTLSFQFSN